MIYRISYLILFFIAFSFFFFIGNSYYSIYGIPFGKIDIDNYLHMHYIGDDGIHGLFLGIIENEYHHNSLYIDIGMVYVWFIPWFTWIILPLLFLFFFKSLNPENDHYGTVFSLFFGTAFAFYIQILGLYSQFLALSCFFVALGFYLRGKGYWNIVFTLLFGVLSVIFHIYTVFVWILFFFFLNLKNDKKHFFMIFLFIFLYMLLPSEYGFTVFDEIKNDSINYSPYIWIYKLLNPFLLVLSIIYWSEDKGKFKNIFFSFLFLGFISHNSRLLPFVMPFLAYGAGRMLDGLKIHIRYLIYFLSIFWFLDCFGFFIEQMIYEMMDLRNMDPSPFLDLFKIKNG